MYDYGNFIETDVANHSFLCWCT